MEYQPPYESVHPPASAPGNTGGADSLFLGAAIKRSEQPPGLVGLVRERLSGRGRKPRESLTEQTFVCPRLLCSRLQRGCRLPAPGGQLYAPAGPGDTFPGSFSFTSRLCDLFLNELMRDGECPIFKFQLISYFTQAGIHPK